jgi:hypothetical protein
MNQVAERYFYTQLESSGNNNTTIMHSISLHCVLVGVWMIQGFSCEENASKAHDFGFRAKILLPLDVQDGFQP